MVNELQSVDQTLTERYQIEIKWALIFFVATLVWMFIERATGLHGEHVAKHALYTNLFAIVAISIYVLAMREKRAHTPGRKFTWQQGFTCGLVMTIVIALLSPIGQLVTHYFITPEFFNNMASHAVNGGYYDSMEQALAFFNLQNYVIQSVFGAAIMGVITSAVVAIFIRRS